MVNGENNNDVNDNNYVTQIDRYHVFLSLIESVDIAEGSEAAS